MPFGKVSLIGVGLLGGSLALAIRRRALAVRVVGYVRREASILECERAGLDDFATLDLAEAVRDADLVVLCTPLGQMADLARQMAPALKPGAIVTDVGSVKKPVADELTSVISAARAEFIGAHPMAGGEKMGVSAARHDLFQNAVCVLTPTAPRSPAVARLQELWQGVGSRVLVITAELHDELVARCSHMPHIIAAQLAMSVLDPQLPGEQSQLCATGFRDTTRIASGSPEMWRDIAMSNRGNLERSLGEFMERLHVLRSLLKEGNAAALHQFFETAKSRRDAWCSQSASPSPE